MCHFPVILILFKLRLPSISMVRKFNNLFKIWKGTIFMTSEIPFILKYRSIYWTFIIQ